MRMSGITETSVGMGEIGVVRSPCLLRAVGIGSCVVAVLYDGHAKVGGMAHIMLPDMARIRDTSRPARFANAAIDKMVEEMKQNGADIRRIQARIYGGANMFPGIISSNSEMDIGRTNVLMTRWELNRYGIEIVVEDVGDHFGRTVLFDTRDGSVSVKTVRCMERSKVVGS